MLKNKIEKTYEIKKNPKKLESPWLTRKTRDLSYEM